MFCTNCGTSNDNDARFCVNCAESLTNVQIEGKRSRSKVLRNVPIFKKINFLQALFDFSFKQFISPKIMKFLYGLSMILAGLMALSLIIAGFEASMWLGILALLFGAPLLFLMTVISNRVFLELILVIYRMADSMENIRLVDIEERPESREGIRWNV
jgi:CDP-diglyceride synthetase